GAELVADRWRMLPDWGLGDRFGAAVLWMGTEMIVLGGTQPPITGTPTVVSGAAYNPVTRRWRPLPQAPEIQFGTASTTMCTEREVVLTNGSLSGPPGAIYTPDTDEWRSLPPTFLLQSPQANPTTRTAWDGKRVAFTFLGGPPPNTPAA